MSDQPASQVTLLDQLRLRQMESWKNRDGVAVEILLQAFTDAPSDDIALELVLSEFELREEHGDEPTFAEYYERFPQLQARLEKLFALRSAMQETHVRDSDVDNTNTTISLSASTKSRELNLESRFGDYELLQEIARGGMGVVFKARHTKLKRLVALKMILAGQLASSDEVRRFHTEAEAIAHLEHPGIVQIFDVGEINNQHYYSMAYVDGPSLTKKLYQGPLPSRQAADLVKSVAVAIEFAHQHGIVHRDLKPQNILLTAEGRPKVVDFGLAKSQGSDQALTATGQVMGTPGYMPPEQAAGRLSDIGPLSDVYSLGAVLYCLLTARPPFQSSNMLETLKQVLEREPVSPRALNPSVDRDLETICLKCLEKDRSKRYQSAQALADDLARYLNGEAVVARPIGPFVRSWRWCRRYPLVAGSIAATVVAVLAFGYAFEARRSALVAQQTVKIKDAFEKQLENVDIEIGRLRDIEATVDALQIIDPLAADDARKRLDERFISAINLAIHQPRLSDPDRKRIAAALAVLGDRDKPATQRLQDEFAKRATAWDMDFELVAPFQNAALAFSPGMVEKSGSDVLRPTGANQTSRVSTAADSSERPILQSLIGCTGSTRVEVVFGSDWQEAASLSLRFGDATQHYDFRFESLKSRGSDDLEAMPNKAIDRSPVSMPLAPADSREAKFVSFRTLQDRGLPGTLSIWRGASLLQRVEVNIGKLAADSFRMMAERDGSKLVLQIQSQPPLMFEDLFPLPSGVSTKVGLECPTSVGLRSLRKWRRSLKSDPGPWQKADELFAGGDIASAAVLFENLELSATSPQVQQEAAYKRSICLIQLNRPDEAQPLLEGLAKSNGNRWSTAASCQLWLLHLRAGRTAEADSIFEPLAAQSESRNLATLIPEDVRTAILDRYLGDFETIPRLLRYNPNRLSDIERAVAVDRLFSTDGKGSIRAARILSKAYQFEGQFPQAKEVLADLVHRAPDDFCLMNYLRVLREMGRPELSIEAFDDWMRAGLVKPESNSGVLHERVRCLIALKKEDEAEREIDRLIQHYQFDTGQLPPLYLMKGFLLEGRGQTEDAKRIWGEGFEKCWFVVSQTGVTNTFILHVLMMGSLSQRMRREHVNEVTGYFVRATASSNIGVFSRTFLAPEGLDSTIRGMWQPPRGREVARKIVFETASMPERMKLPIALAASEYVRRNSIGDEFDADQEAISWQFADKLVERFFGSQSFSAAQMAQFAASWKGTLGLLGWGSLAPTLSQEMRCDASYLLAHRAVRLNQQAQVVSLLQAAMKHPDRQSSAVRLATRDLQLLQSKSGILRIESDMPQRLKLVFESDSHPAREVVVAESTSPQVHEAEIVAGTYRIRLEPADESLHVAPSELIVRSMGRHTIRVHRK